MKIDLSAFLVLDAGTSLGPSASGAAFATSSGDVLEVTSYGAGAFRLRVGPNTRPDYGFLLGRSQRCEVTQSSPNSWSFASGATRLELTGRPLQLRLFHQDHLALTSITDEDGPGSTRLPPIGKTRQGQHWIAAFALVSGEPVYGLGERSEALNKRGQLIASDEAGDTENSQQGVPFCWSPGSPHAGRSAAWGIFAHTAGRVVHGVGFAPWSQRSYGIVVEDEALDLFLFAGREPAEILERYTQLTGRAPELPPWSLGVWCAHGDRSAGEAAHAVRELREHGMPCDVIALDDRALWDVETQFDFLWDRARYPDPRQALGNITQHAVRICAAEGPYVSIHSPLFGELAQKRFLLSSAAGDPCIVEADGAEGSPTRRASAPVRYARGLVDFTEPRAFAWWRDAHEPLFASGIDVFSVAPCGPLPLDAVAANGDSGGRLQNVYPWLHRQCVFEATKKFGAARNGAPLLIGRTAGPAGQRYPLAAPARAQADWEGLAASVRAALSSSMSGTASRVMEVGNTYGSSKLGAELYLRWLQVAVFGSHLRLRGAIAAEPWRFGDKAAEVARHWLQFRYRLLPYLQRTLSQSAATGLPVMRAMAMAFPGNALTRPYETQFMCGDALLVAPIIAEGGEVDVALPPGAWYDLASRQRIAGRQIVRYRAPLDRFPVFCREGFALPLGRAVAHTGEIDWERPLDTLWLFGKPAHPLTDFRQVRIGVDNGIPSVAADASVKVEVFGDSRDLRIDVIA